MSYPCCPFCYEGEVVEEDKIKGSFLCNKCLRKIKIRKKKNSFVKYA